MDGRKLHQMIDGALSGSGGPDGALSADERAVIERLGAAVVALWADLPRDLQGRLFETAAGAEGQTQRTALARVLHDHHERTKEAGSLPSAGPHARDHLVNPDATPGAGALPSAEKTSGEVDAGAG